MNFLKKNGMNKLNIKYNNNKINFLLMLDNMLQIFRMYYNRLTN